MSQRTPLSEEEYAAFAAAHAPSAAPPPEHSAVAAYRRQRAAALRQRRRRRMLALAAAVCVCLAGIGIAVWRSGAGDPPGPGGEESSLHPLIETPSWVQKAYLDIDGEARSGRKLDKVQGIAIHYVGNPGTTAMQNRNYFNQPGVEVSSHFIVGLEGEIVQCLPLDERSVATNQRNGDTISVEVCHPDETGQYNPTTYAAVVKLAAWLCQQYDLTADSLLRHYDVSGKLCPLYYVEHEDAWLQLKADVADALAALKTAA